MRPSPSSDVEDKAVSPERNHILRVVAFISKDSGWRQRGGCGAEDGLRAGAGRDRWALTGARGAVSPSPDCHSESHEESSGL